MDLYNSFENWTSNGKKVMLQEKIFCTCTTKERSVFIADRLNCAAKTEKFMITMRDNREKIMHDKRLLRDILNRNFDKKGLK